MSGGSSGDLPQRGMLTLDEVRDETERGELTSVLAVFPDMYGRLLGKRITGRFFLDSVADKGLHVCDYLLASDMEMDPVPGYSFASWDTGYGDVHLVCDLKSLRRAAWLPRTALVLCDVYGDPNNEAVSVAPRHMLRKQLDRAREMGFSVNSGSELEFYLFNESYESAAEKRYHDLKTTGRYVEDYHIFQSTKEEDVIGSIRESLEASGVPVEFSKGEWGPGQQEINLRYSDPLQQSDANVIYKQAAKDIAFSRGKAVTFMAKWDENLAGSSMHVHVSLSDATTGESCFPGSQDLGSVRSERHVSLVSRRLDKRGTRDDCLLCASINSYKRFQEGSFAPTGIAWSVDNRTAGFRVVGEGASLRIECRIPGADANPYIVYAAVIASGLHGIEHRVEPPPVFDGDIYAAASLPRIPKSLREATVEFEKSTIAREAFGEDVVEHYAHFFRTEQRKFDEAVTCWERERFFERA